MSDILERAAPFVGAPYRLHGQEPDGWDCLGCVKHLRRVLFDRLTPWGPDLYSRADAADPERREALVTEQLPLWARIEPEPGAVVLFERLGRLDHVGLLLTDRLFIHALSPDAGTVIDDLRGKWRRRERGVFECKT